eukprot:TRINITY_DN54879_c0_g2_i1.p1 TRINITY_DN54879_c0_g2~~TRINITY_DN54879_c0_g2_i1.p1  ORF type:complete len:232 (-),score=32.25 TRINITY_DN54879_c0_g2_i1:171-866(-)
MHHAEETGFTSRWKGFDHDDLPTPSFASFDEFWEARGAKHRAQWAEELAAARETKVDQVRNAYRSKIGRLKRKISSVINWCSEETLEEVEARAVYEVEQWHQEMFQRRLEYMRDSPGTLFFDPMDMDATGVTVCGQFGPGNRQYDFNPIYYCSISMPSEVRELEDRIDAYGDCMGPDDMIKVGSDLEELLSNEAVKNAFIDEPGEFEYVAGMARHVKFWGGRGYYLMGCPM